MSGYVAGTAAGGSTAMSVNYECTAGDRPTLSFQRGQWGQENPHIFQSVMQQATRDSNGAMQWGQGQRPPRTENCTGGVSPLCVPIVPSAVPSRAALSGDRQSPENQRFLSLFAGVPTVPSEELTLVILVRESGQWQ
jgi:hypothetical protein